MDIISTRQEIFNGFNDFIMSEDTKVFGKLLARIELMKSTQNVCGDIVEAGIFKGSGLFTFLKCKKFFYPNGKKKVIGFDFFDDKELIKAIDVEHDKQEMKKLFQNRKFTHLNYYEKLKEKISNCGFKDYEYELVKGDIIKTSKEYVEKNPGFKISLLYMDLDIDEPTYQTLVNFWDRMSIGGIIVFDEYNYGCWTETNAVDRFARKKGLKINYLDFLAPTAFILKQ